MLCINIFNAYGLTYFKYLTSVTWKSNIDISYTDFNHYHVVSRLCNCIWDPITAIGAVADFKLEALKSLESCQSSVL